MTLGDVLPFGAYIRRLTLLNDTTALETVCRPKLGLNVIKLSTKFEVSAFTHYEDKKGNAICRN